MLKCPLLFHDQQLVNACTPTITSQILCPRALATLPVSRNHVRLCVPLYRTWNVIAEAKTWNEYIYIIAVIINYSIVASICCMKCIKSRNYLKHQEATMHRCSHYNSIVLHKKCTAIIIMGITKCKMASDAARTKQI